MLRVNPLQQRNAVQILHHDVGQHQIERIQSQRIQRFAGAAGQPHLVSHALQCGTHRRPDLCLIVHHQHPSRPARRKQRATLDLRPAFSALNPAFPVLQGSIPNPILPRSGASPGERLRLQRALLTSHPKPEPDHRLNGSNAPIDHPPKVLQAPKLSRSAPTRRLPTLQPASLCRFSCIHTIFRHLRGRGAGLASKLGVLAPTAHADSRAIPRKITNVFKKEPQRASRIGSKSTSNVYHNRTRFAVNCRCFSIRYKKQRGSKLAPAPFFLHILVFWRSRRLSR